MNDKADSADKVPQQQAAVWPDDLYLIICQDNARRRIRIQHVSDELARLLGRPRGEMEGCDLSDILGDGAAGALGDYLEYEDDSPDVDRVLGRVTEFRLKRHNGEELAFVQKFLREPSRDANQWFRLMLKDEKRQIQEGSLQSLLREHVAGVRALDETTGLADRQTGERYLEQVYHYVRSNHVTACFAAIRLDRFGKSVAHYGRAGAEQLLNHVARSCKASFREEDLVFRLGEDRLGLLLLDTTVETARVVLNRLRWTISSHRIAFGGKANFSVTVSVAFAPLGTKDEPDALSAAEGVITALDENERNQLLEAG